MYTNSLICKKLNCQQYSNHREMGWLPICAVRLVLKRLTIVRIVVEFDTSFMM